jgi:hypothetical protein
MMSVDLSITMTAAVPRPDRCSRSQSKSMIAPSRITLAGQQRHGGAAGDHRLEVVPAAADAAAMLLDQLVEGDRHRLLDHAGLVDVARRSAKSLVPALLGRRSPRTTPRRGAGSSARRRSIRRCSPWWGSRRGPRPPGTAASSAACPSCPRGFPAAPSPRRRCRRPRRGGGRGRNPSPTRGVLAQQPRVVGLVDGGLQGLALADVFAADVDVAGVRPHREGLAIRQPSISVCGSWRMISRSLQVPGSDSSALTTR